ncbi:MAG: long-chain fatty acid--CoA ligase [Candidatus Bathyarchaeia archaeon]
MRNFSGILTSHTEKMPHKEALVYGSRRITYAELNKDTHAFASALRQLDVCKDDRVALLLYNCPEFLVAAFAINRLGAVFVPMNYRLASDEVKFILEDSGAKVLITEHELRPTVDPILSGIQSLKAFIALDGPGDVGLKYAEMIESHRGQEVIDAVVSESDLHRVVYTSGTTARPKGVMLSYANLYSKNDAHREVLHLTSEDRVLVAGPLYHVGGMDLPFTGVLQLGGTGVILRKFNVDACLDAIVKEMVTIVWLAPTMMNMILNNLEVKNLNFNSLRLIIDGGEKMPEDRVNKVLDIFTNVWFADAYGLTETLSGDTFLTKDKMSMKIGSVGKPVPNLELRIVDENERQLPPNQPDEIVLKGQKVFKGYWNNAEATRIAMKDGWFHTGDVGYLDDEGFLYVVDRKKDMIKSGGENIASVEIERVIYHHPKILEAAVVAAPDEQWGEVPAAYVVPKKNMQIKPDELARFIGESLAKFKIPKHFFFLTQLPRNPSGKVLKADLRLEARKILTH